MMAGFMNLFGPRRDSRQAARDAIVALRQQLQMLEKKEEYIIKKMDEEMKKAKANAVSNKTLATAALRRKKALETDLDRLGGQRMQLELQVNTLESANLNAETMKVMVEGSEVLKRIHGNLTPQRVEEQMDRINEQREIADEISAVISNPMTANEIDDEELKEELAELERIELDERLIRAEPVPVHNPAGASAVAAEPARRQQVEEDDEDERQLKELQAALAM